MRGFLTLLAVFLLASPVSFAVAADVDCTGCVDATDLADRAVAKRHLAPAAVGTNKIETEAVTGAKLADGAVGYDKLDDGLRERMSASTGQPMTRLVDANGVLVGTVASIYLAEPDAGVSDWALIWTEAGGQSVLLRFADGTLSGFEGEHLTFATSDCSGAPFAPVAQQGQLADLRGYSLSPDGRVWKALSETAEARFVWSALSVSTERCIPLARSDLNLLTEEVGLLPDFEAPFAFVYE